MHLEDAQAKYSRSWPVALHPSLTRRSVLGGALVAGSIALSSPAYAVRAFADVPRTHPFYTHIMWCREKGYVTGWADNTFRPSAHITREAFAAILCRFMGLSVASAPTRSPFTDVKTTDLFYKQIATLASRGIILGFRDGTFRPKQSINRADVAVIISRWGGGTPVTSLVRPPFKDVPLTFGHVKGIDYVKKNGFLLGYRDGTYRPHDPIQRDAIAALLYRIAQKRASLPTLAGSWTLRRGEESPYTRSIVYPVRPDYKEVDSRGILVSTYQGRRVRHPVNTAWWALSMLKSYQLTKNRAYLDPVIATMNDLVKYTTVTGGARWYRYDFAHQPGSLAMGVPWYSGMAQGMMLSVHALLYTITKDPQQLRYLNEVLKTFDHSVAWSQRKATPWCVLHRPLNGTMMTFFEEYPDPNPGHRSGVVNGHIYALWGLFDAYSVTGSDLARKHFLRGAASIKAVFDDYRRPGNPSWYAITRFGRDTWGSPISYHRGVAYQLKVLGALTGDQGFVRQSETLTRDYT